MNISHIPNQAGVYFFKDKTGNILYIGKAKILQKRVSQYFSPGSVWKQEMISKAQSVDFVIAQNESEALYLEDNLIKKHKPYYNNMLKGSNSYAYIKITNEEFPQIYITRKKFNDGSIYIGPKHNTMQLKNFLQYLRQVLQYRGCKISQFKQHKLCSDYYFGLCKGWCLPSAIASSNNLISKNKKDLSEGQITKNYKSIINYIESFFHGDIKPIQEEILSQINQSIQLQNFERAAKLRDIYNNIEGLSQQQTVVLTGSITGYIFKIKKIGAWFVYVLLYFNQGKLVDIIRHKFHQDDADFASLISSISNECGDFKITPVKLNTNSDNIIGINKCIKKLSKSDIQEIDKLIEGFFDSYVISTSFEGENLNNELLKNLQSRYKFKNFPYHIECVDISHLGGSWTSGGLSCFLGGLAERKYYRRYKITVEISQGNSPDDYASLKELITRRFKNKDFLPNLFILDGGKGQLGIIKKLYDEDKSFHQIFAQIDFVSLGKGEARKKSKIGQTSSKGKIGEKIYYFDKDFNIKSIALIYDQTDKILVNIRNEAHRFSNAYRENQMNKIWKK
ncbi:MAG: GIY-YIG nuclease family protein [Candidatus Absconditicoccaceae bacterium]